MSDSSISLVASGTTPSIAPTRVIVRPTTGAAFQAAVFHPPVSFVPFGESSIANTT